MDPTARFEALVQGPRGYLEDHLDEATLLIAAHARPGLDVDLYRRRLDDLATSCGDERVLAEISHRLFVVEGFRGNDVDYGDPRNSFLDEVLDRRVGIPITLAVVLMEVARRLDVPLAGVSMPGHFLVRMRGEPAVLIDAFDGGRMLSGTECHQWFVDRYGSAAPWDPAYLEPVGATAILSRMLTNLRNSFLERQQSVSLEWVLRLRGLLPGATIEQRAERAGVLAALAQFGEAAVLLEHLADEADDERSVALLSRARRVRARLN